MKLDTMGAAQLQSRVMCVLNASVLNTSRLPLLVAEAAQYSMSSSLLRTTSTGSALSAEGIWRSLDPAIQIRRAQQLRTRAHADQGRRGAAQGAVWSGTLPAGNPEVTDPGQGLEALHDGHEEMAAGCRA